MSFFLRDNSFCISSVSTLLSREFKSALSTGSHTAAYRGVHHRPSRVVGPVSKRRRRNVMEDGRRNVPRRILIFFVHHVQSSWYVTKKEKGKQKVIFISEAFQKICFSLIRGSRMTVGFIHDCPFTSLHKKDLEYTRRLEN